ncbi:MAG: hypothetical protein VXZ29_01725, partial [Pseudomonadota bacterium]|nr:hypothetical protein [Pseudomonadota bacterium]
MESSIEKTLQQGIAAHNAGNLQEAERVYRAILQSQPRYALPKSTCSLLPFSSEIARAAQSSAIVPARICIVNRICTLIFFLAVMFLLD